MDNPGEILRLCRLCLVKDQVNIPIFEEQGDIRQIFLKISSCLPVKVSRDDQLPKKICDGCLNKLDLLYEFWNTSVNAEKTLLSWLGQAGVKDADEKISAVAQQIAKSAETQVKQEALEDGHAPEVQSFEEEAKDESEAPPPKRARRTAAVKAQINITPESDDDDDMDSAEAMTKVEDESDESDGEDKDPSYGEVPGTSADDQAGPSGVGKDGVEAPSSDENSEFNDKAIALLDDIEQHYDEINDDNSENEMSIYVEKILNSNIIDEMSEDENKGNISHEEEFEGHTGDLSTIKDYFDLEYSSYLNKSYCNICGEGFENILELHYHLNTPKKNHYLICRNCKRNDFPSIFSIKNHFSKCPKKMFKKKEFDYFKKHPQFIQYYCDFCGSGFSCLTNFLRHKEKKHLLNRMICPVCYKPYKDSDFLESHIRRHSLLGNIDLICKYCSLHFYSTTSYRTHLSLVHFQRKNIIFRCCMCSKKFIDKEEEFKRHVIFHKILNIEEFADDRAVMKNGRPLQNVTDKSCPICSKLFLRKNDCKTHETIDHPEFLVKTRKMLKFNQEANITKQGAKIIKKYSKSNFKKIFKCSVCHAFVAINKFQALRKEDAAIKCTECYFTFQSIENYINQLKTLPHQNDSKPPLPFSIQLSSPPTTAPALLADSDKSHRNKKNSKGKFFVTKIEDASLGVPESSQYNKKQKTSKLESSRCNEKTENLDTMKFENANKQERSQDPKSRYKYTKLLGRDLSDISDSEKSNEYESYDYNINESNTEQRIFKNENFSAFNRLQTQSYIKCGRFFDDTPSDHKVISRSGHFRGIKTRNGSRIPSPEPSDRRRQLTRPKSPQFRCYGCSHLFSSKRTLFSHKRKCIFL